MLGGGDTAVEEAIYLANICKKVYLIHRRDGFRCAPITLEHAKNNDKIEFLTPYVVEEIKGDASGVSSLSIKNTATNEKRELVVPGLFIFVGYDVNNAVLKQEDESMLCECDEYGSIVVDFSMKTNVQGLFAAGDIRIFAPKQVVCAASDGATAALSVISYLEHH